MTEGGTVRGREVESRENQRQIDGQRQRKTSTRKKERGRERLRKGGTERQGKTARQISVVAVAADAGDWRSWELLPVVTAADDVYRIDA